MFVKNFAAFLEIVRKIHIISLVAKMYVVRDVRLNFVSHAKLAMK